MALQPGLIARAELFDAVMLHKDQSFKRGFDAERGHVMDYERLEILRKVGDEVAIHLMWQEGRPL